MKADSIIHVLKTWPEYFEKVLSGEKTFEIRYNDRKFKVGEYLLLREWKYEEEEFTDRCVFAKITYIFVDEYLLKRMVAPDYVVMSFKVLD